MTDPLLPLLALRGGRTHPKWQREVQTPSSSPCFCPRSGLGKETSFHQHTAQERTGRAPCIACTGGRRSLPDMSPSTQPQQSDLSTLSQVHPCNRYIPFDQNHIPRCCWRVLPFALRQPPSTSLQEGDDESGGDAVSHVYSF